MPTPPKNEPKVKPEAVPEEAPSSAPSPADIEAQHQRNVDAAQAHADTRAADFARSVTVAGGVPVSQTVAPVVVERVTVEQFSRRLGRGSIVEVFASEDRREHGVRKLPEAEWSKLFDAFTKKPR